MIGNAKIKEMLKWSYVATVIYLLIFYFINIYLLYSAIIAIFSQYYENVY